jgi:hypothetical protein
MKRKNRIFTALIASFFTCLVPVAIYAQSPQVGEITTGRARALVGAVVGLISLVIGGLALLRSTGRGVATVALVLGLLGIILSVVHLGTSTGGFGTGSGRAGAIVALVLSLIGTSLGGLTLSRHRRTVS